MAMTLAVLTLLGFSLFALASGSSANVVAPAPAPDAVRSERGLVLAQDAARQMPGLQEGRVTNPPPDAKQAPAAGSGAGEDGPRAYVTFKTPYEFFLCVITVLLGIGTMLLLVVMYWQSGPSEEFIRAFIVTTVIFAALFLIVAGYNEKQTAPVFGLLGTILGYVFGKVASPAPAPTTGETGEAATGRGQSGAQT